jgi:CRISPR associated protein Cas1
MKPLYLQAGAGMQVDYEEPALQVTMPARARQLFPLLRISRVVVSGYVLWSMEALLACADAGIAIVFIANDGEIRARWLGCNNRRQRLLQSVLDMLQCCDAFDRYQDWLRGMRRMAVRSAARRLGFADWRDADALALEMWLENTGQVGWQGVETRLQSLLMSTVLAYLGEYGLDARSGGLLQGRLNLPGDLCTLLVWDFYPALYVWQKRCHNQSTGHRDLIEFYERRSQRTENLLRGTMNKLHPLSAMESEREG